jgi:hypothetical protein
MVYDSLILSAHARWQRQEGSRRAQTSINLGSGGSAVVMAGRWQRNAFTAEFWGQEGGGRRAAVFVGWQQGVDGGEG